MRGRINLGRLRMKKEVIVRLHASFEELVQRDEQGGEFWLARDLQVLLEYAKWENFAKVIERARTACQVSGYEPEDHFLDVRKMVDLGSGATRAIDDIALTRYACYLIAQNGDPSKDAVAFAQTYFALQTRKQELIEQRISEVERLSARKKLTLTGTASCGNSADRAGAARRGETGRELLRPYRMAAAAFPRCGV
jgi:DNA-damage-inducible protein D